MVGDAQYGKSRINAVLQAEYGLPRLFLHAERLRLQLDADALAGEPALEVEVHDPLAEDLAAFLQRLPP